MVQRKNQVDQEDFMFEEEYDSTFNKASDESDNALLFIGASAGLLAIIDSLNSLTASEMEAVMAEAGETSAEAMGSIDYITSTLPESLPALEEAVTLTPAEFTHLNQMMEEAKQYGRMMDPKTVENIAFQNQSRIADQMGMFGGTEAEKQGEISAYYNESVLIPWVPVGDANTCEDCLELETNGPYRPDEYPEPPHYGCRCTSGDPIIVLPGEVAKSLFKKFKNGISKFLKFFKL